MLWSKNLETGILTVDEQHKEIFRQADILFGRDKADRVTSTFTFLEDYVVKHFTDEQALHLKVQYPKREPHKKMHAGFTTALKKMEEEYKNSDGNLKILLKINKTFCDWLTGHIMVHDKEFTAYYNARQAK
jgi:hemerythrin